PPSSVRSGMQLRKRNSAPFGAWSLEFLWSLEFGVWSFFPSFVIQHMTLLFTVILVALVFEYINGFHDTANSIATVVSTKVLTPRQAIVLAASTNLLGAMWGTAVAKTISSGLIDSKLVNLTSEVIICALLGAILWNLITWWSGLPSSSSHALIGGLCGSALAAAGNNWSVIIWSQPSLQHPWLG